MADVIWQTRHRFVADASFDGGDLDCGNGLLLLIRRHLDPLLPGQMLEIRSRELSVEEDLPAWARLTGNELLSKTKHNDDRSFLICKGRFQAKPDPELQPSHAAFAEPKPGPTAKRSQPPSSAAPPAVGPFSVMGVGSWPRPRWMVQALHDFLERRLEPQRFHDTADDAVRLAISAQERAGVDVVTDGEQRRDNYASFVGNRLDNCQLVPITDLLAYVDDPEKFAAELRSLDVPADKVRHPAVFGPIRRTKPLAVHELEFARQCTARPVKIALPGPYLLTRTMWLDCVSDRAYASREELALDVCRVLREEISELLTAGAAIVQLDEPVLSEVVFGRPAKTRSFMCGALGERRDPEQELQFASELIRGVMAGFPAERMALHICRGNWSRDERVALAGGYEPLVPLLQTIPAGTIFLELCTPRAGEIEALRQLPNSCRVGIGVVNPKTDSVEPVAEIVARAERAVQMFGPERILLNPDCGFATFADSPVALCQIAEAKLAAIVAARDLLRRRFEVSSL